MNLRKNKQSLSRRNSGFTLIELLVVIAVLGVLAVVVITAINPFQQLAKARDAGRISVVAQLGRAAVSLATNNGGTYPTANSTWITSLQTAGEINIIPASIAYSIAGISACTTNVQNLVCYKTSAVTGPAIVYATLEALSNTSRCPANQSAWAVFSSADGRAGIVCSATEPAAGSQTFLP